MSTGHQLDKLGASVCEMITTIMGMELTDTASIIWRRKLARAVFRMNSAINILGDMIDLCLKKETFKGIDREITIMRAMFEAMDVELENNKIQELKIPMQEVLNRYISEVRAKAYGDMVTLGMVVKEITPTTPRSPLDTVSTSD